MTRKVICNEVLNNTRLKVWENKCSWYASLYDISTNECISSASFQDGDCSIYKIKSYFGFLTK